MSQVVQNAATFRTFHRLFPKGRHYDDTQTHFVAVSRPTAGTVTILEVLSRIDYTRKPWNTNPKHPAIFRVICVWERLYPGSQFKRVKKLAEEYTQRLNEGMPLPGGDFELPIFSPTRRCKSLPVYGSRN